MKTPLPSDILAWRQAEPLLTAAQVLAICKLADEYAMAKARSEKQRDYAKRMAIPFSELLKPVNRAKRRLIQYLQTL